MWLYTNWCCKKCSSLISGAQSAILLATTADFVLMNEDGQFAVTAVAESGWQFVKWSDGQTNPSRTVTYTDNTSLCAYFEPVTPLISWNSITPLSSGSVAELSHPYSASEPWLDILYIGDMWIDSQSLLGGGIYVDKGENDQLGKYISVKHSTTTTIRYGGLAVYPSRDLNTYIDGRVLSLALYAQSGKCADLRIQVLVDGVVVDPETVLPALSTVDWLYAKGEAPRPTQHQHHILRNRSPPRYQHLNRLPRQHQHRHHIFRNRSPPRYQHLTNHNQPRKKNPRGNAAIRQSQPRRSNSVQYGIYRPFSQTPQKMCAQKAR